jgi:hypothetical protein
MEHYVTLFDSLFLPQGLTLHASMVRHVKSFTLWILCVDDLTQAVLANFDLPGVRLLRLSELETPALLAVKAGRSKGEYCWTLTPFAPRFVFDADVSVERVTYIDADLWFRKDPWAIFREFDTSGKDVLITEHAYSADQDHSMTNGHFCVQFMVFNRRGGEVARRWWEEKCLEWCFARLEDGRFGDQKYLDDWPERFSETVHVLGNKELLLAPWNATRFPYGNAVAWHFHSFRICKGRSRTFAEFGPYPLPKTTRLHVYSPYLEDISRSIQLLEEHHVEVVSQKENRPIEYVISLLKKVAYQFKYSGYAHRERIQ